MGVEHDATLRQVLVTPGRRRCATETCCDWRWTSCCYGSSRSATSMLRLTDVTSRSTCPRLQPLHWADLRYC